MNVGIHPELQKAGQFIKLVFRANRLSLRFYHWVSNRTPNAQLEGFKNATHQVNRSRGQGSVRVRVYGPLEHNEALPVLLYFHGGGYAINAPESAHVAIERFLTACPCVVVAPDYTKSVHAPYPAAINDCEDTLDWLLAEAEQLGIRTDKVMVAGHSAGGGLTIALMLRVRERGDVSIAFQMPIYPMIDHRSVTESARNNDMPVWNTKLNKLAWKMYLGDFYGTDDRPSPDVPADAAPAQAANYNGLPPAATFVGDLDPFRDETRNYVQELRQAGVEVEFEEFKQCYHAFELIVPEATPSIRAIEFTRTKFAQAVERYTAPQPNSSTF